MLPDLGVSVVAFQVQTRTRKFDQLAAMASLGVTPASKHLALDILRRLDSAAFQVGPIQVAHMVTVAILANRVGIPEGG